MRREDVRAFVRRDWDAVADAKTEAWLERRRRVGVGGTLAQADELRRQVRRLRPDWPTEDERQEDLAVHTRVAEALRRAGRTRRR